MFFNTLHFAKVVQDGVVWVASDHTFIESKHKRNSKEEIINACYLGIYLIVMFTL